MNETSVGIIILAAGASTRMGKAKQLLKFQGKTLIAKVIKSAINSRCSETVVVLGSNAENIKPEISDFPIKICINKNWQSGMASSLKYGLRELLVKLPNLNALIILLCDQPFIDSNHINLLIEKFDQTNKAIVAAEYKNTVGVPALFSNKIFAELFELKGDKGARQIIKSHPTLLEKVELPEAEFDIDTREDVEKLLQSA